MRGGVGRAVVVLALAVGACSDEDGGDAAEPSAALVADFSYEADHHQLGPTSCPLKDVVFTDESSGDPEGWEWEFGDGSTSTEPDPVVTARIHEATLTVTRGDETDTVTRAVQIHDC